MTKRTLSVFSILILAAATAFATSDALAGSWPNQGDFVGGTTGLRHAVVVDIDGSLTIYTNGNFGDTNGIFLNTGNAYTRDDSVLLMNIYYRLGYDIVYVCGRPKDMTVNGMPMGDATLKWLHDNGYPTEPDRTVLLISAEPDSVVINAADPGEAMAENMGKHGTDMIAGMLKTLQKKTKISYDYGYNDSDVVVNAFLKAGVPADHIFTIGNLGVSRLGYKGSHPITGRGLNPGYGRHIVDYVIPNVPDVGDRN